MNNLPAHNVASILEIIEDVGDSLLYLPPYMPEFNLIEIALSYLKAFLRKTAARKKEILDDVIAGVIECYSAQQRANYIKAYGYVPE